MAIHDASSRASVPSVDRLLQRSESHELIARFGRSAVTDAIRSALAATRASPRPISDSNAADEIAILDRATARVIGESRPSLRPVYNLTGTVLHTNLGRATLPAEAIEAVSLVAAGASNLEYNLEDGVRGDRDDHLEGQLCRLTGAEAATVVNNNAAAVLLVLNTLGLRNEVPTSRGELIEIGGSVPPPDITPPA